MTRATAMTSIGLLLALVCPRMTRASTDPSAAVEMASLWEESVRALSNDAPLQAVDRLDRWIALAASQDLHSPEAHYNLGLAHWAAKQPGRAVFHLVQSAQLQGAPWRAYGSALTLQTLERELGIRDGVSSSPAFHLHFALNRDTCWALATLALWLAAAGWFLRWKRGSGTLRPRLACFAASGACLFLAGVGWLNHRFLGQLAVIDGEGESVSLYKSSDGGDEAKVVDLPVGTIVTVKQTSPTHAEVVRPVSGWLASGSLLKIPAD